VLKNEDTLAAYSLESGSVLHMVERPANAPANSNNDSPPVSSSSSASAASASLPNGSRVSVNIINVDSNAGASSVVDSISSALGITLPGWLVSTIQQATSPAHSLESVLQTLESAGTNNAGSAAAASAASASATAPASPAPSTANSSAATTTTTTTSAEATSAPSLASSGSGGTAARAPLTAPVLLRVATQLDALSARLRELASNNPSGVVRGDDALSSRVNTTSTLLVELAQELTTRPSPAPANGDTSTSVIATTTTTTNTTSNAAPATTTTQRVPAPSGISPPIGATTLQQVSHRVFAARFHLTALSVLL
jgi:hypothetical protein